MPKDPNRRGRGVSYGENTLITTGGITNAADVPLLSSVTGYVLVVHRIYVVYGTANSAFDFDFKTTSMDEWAPSPDPISPPNGTQSSADRWTIDDSGVAGPTAPVAMLTWVNPAPRTNGVEGYIEFDKPIVLDYGTDTTQAIAVRGNDATANNNFNNGTGLDLEFTVIYEKIPRGKYYQDAA